MKFLYVLFIIPLCLVPAFAETQIVSTNEGTLDVRLTHDTIEPDAQTRIAIDFINPQTQKIQEHIDYTVTVSKDDTAVFGPIPLTHTSLGTVKIPVEFSLGDGAYMMDIEIEGILFQPIPKEVASFDILVGEVNAEPVMPPESDGGGCLIATATFGSELAPQVQQLRELRDNTVLKTGSGAAFMSAFNQFYYSFSPTVADFERENPVFREAMKVTLAPMLASLSLLNGVQIDSEQEMLGYGISIILLNVGMYIAIPVFGVLRLCQFKSR